MRGKIAKKTLKGLHGELEGEPSRFSPRFEGLTARPIKGLLIAPLTFKVVESVDGDGGNLKKADVAEIPNELG